MIRKPRKTKRQALREVATPKGKILTGRDVSSLINKGWTYGTRANNFGGYSGTSYLINPLGNRSVFMNIKDIQLVAAPHLKGGVGVKKKYEIVSTHKTRLGGFHAPAKQDISERALKRLRTRNIR